MKEILDPHDGQALADILDFVSFLFLKIAEFHVQISHYHTNIHTSSAQNLVFELGHILKGKIKLNLWSWLKTLRVSVKVM